jgi:hypothetical protein
MTKRRAIVSLEKLTAEQKKRLEQDFPDGFLGSLTSIKTPTGQMMDALIWETEEIIYLVKVNKAAFISALNDEEDDESEEDDFEEDEIEPVDKEDVDSEEEEDLAKKKSKDEDEEEDGDED